MNKITNMARVFKKAYYRELGDIASKKMRKHVDDADCRVWERWFVLANYCLKKQIELMGK